MEPDTVDGKDERRVLPLPRVNRSSLQTHPHEPMVAAAERRRGALEMYGESVLRGRVVALIEEVHKLLDAHRVRVRQITVLHESPRHGVRRGVHVHGESGQMVVLGVDEGVYPVVLEESEVVGLVVDCRGSAYDVEPFGPTSISLGHHHLYADLFHHLRHVHLLHRHLFDHLPCAGGQNREQRYQTEHYRDSDPILLHLNTSRSESSIARQT